MYIVYLLHERVYWPFQGGASFAETFPYLCFMLVCVMSSCLFLATLWSPDGKGWTIVCSVVLCLCCFPYVLPLDGCGAWLNQFLIFAFYFTLINKLFV